MVAFSECRTRAVHSQIHDIFVTRKTAREVTLALYAHNKRFENVRDTCLRIFSYIDQRDNKYRDIKVNILSVLIVLLLLCLLHPTGLLKI